MLILIGIELLVAFLVCKYLDADFGLFAFIIGIGGFVWVFGTYQKYTNVMDMFFQIK